MKHDRRNWVQFDDAGPDEQGRRHFTLFWLYDGELPGTGSTFAERGMRRAQCFHADPSPYANAVRVTRAPWESP